MTALIRARKDAGLSQAELAERLRCHQSFVARIESGQRHIEVPGLVVLCRALSANLLEITDEVAEATPPNARI